MHPIVPEGFEEIGERLTDSCEGVCPWGAFLCGATPGEEWPQCLHPSVIVQATRNYVDGQRLQLTLNAMCEPVHQHPVGPGAVDEPLYSWTTAASSPLPGEPGCVVLPDTSAAQARPVPGGGYQIGWPSEEGDRLDVWVPLLIPGWVETTDESAVLDDVIRENAALDCLARDASRFVERLHYVSPEPEVQAQALLCALYVAVKDLNLPPSAALLGALIHKVAPDLAGIIAPADYAIPRRGAPVSTMVVVYAETSTKGTRRLVCKVVTTTSLSYGTRRLLDQVWRIRRLSRESVPSLFGIALTGEDNLPKRGGGRPKFDDAEGRLVARHVSGEIGRDAFISAARQLWLQSVEKAKLAGRTPDEWGQYRNRLTARVRKARKKPQREAN
ncbi:MAG: hypothetical protein FJX72_20170 [Armatimonadetes bacterium]|nr:hypothetical protein [Armatimonadota bacterium]